MPALRLSPAADVALARNELAAALACPVCLFTSPAAVRFAAALLSLNGPLCIAIGPSTASGLRRAGVLRVVSPANDPRSEGALALPELTPPPAEIGLVTAPGGRGLLGRILTERGSRVRRANVYRREPLAPTAAARRRLMNVDGPLALLVSSGEALAAALAGLAPDERAHLQRAVGVCASERLAQLASEHGFEHICVSDSTQPAEQLRCLMSYVREVGFR